MIKLGILTDKVNQHLILDESGLDVLLTELGIDNRVIVWDEVDWSKFKNILVRTPWDYALKNKLFLKTLYEAEEYGVHVIHSPEMISWNMDKAYLQELGNKTAVVQTRCYEQFEFSLLNQCFEEFGETLVIKPQIGAGGKDTFKVSRLDDFQCLKVLLGKSVLIQPFISSVIEEGEYSFIFFNQKFSHAVLKKAKSGEFRVQDDHGGTVEVYYPSPKEIAEVEGILHACPFTTLYARVDVVRHQGHFLLMELEIIEPELFFRFSENAMKTFCETIKLHLKN